MSGYAQSQDDGLRDIEDIIVPLNDNVRHGHC